MMSDKPNGAMSSPYGNFMGDLTVINTDYVEKIKPLSDKEFETLKTGLEKMGAVLKAKNSKLIVFEFGGMQLQVAKVNGT